MVAQESRAGKQGRGVAIFNGIFPLLNNKR
jgi:hypothetical protein